MLQQIGFAGKSGAPWTRLWDIAIGNIIITALGFVPGAFTFFVLPLFPSIGHLLLHRTFSRLLAGLGYGIADVLHRSCS